MIKKLLICGALLFGALASAADESAVPTDLHIYIAKPPGENQWLFCADEYRAEDGSVIVQRTFEDMKDQPPYNIITAMKIAAEFGINIHIHPALDFNCWDPTNGQEST